MEKLYTNIGGKLRTLAKICGRCGIFGVLLIGLLLWMILGAAL